MAVDKNDCYARFELAKIEIKEQNYDLAEHYLQEIIDLKDDIYAMFELGKLKAHSGDLEKAKEIRLSEKGKELYSLRKLTIERVFAEGKEKHGLRYTRYKSRQKNFNMRALLYACLNMKKLGNLINEFPSYMKNVKQVWG